MEQRVDLITVRTEDVEAATAFYVDALGWEPLMTVPGEVAFIQIGPGKVMSLFDAAGFDRDIGTAMERTFTLAQNVPSEAAVRTTVEEMVKAGARVIKAPQRAEFGGFHAYVTDPSGVLWEIAHNPGWSVAEDGTVTLEPVE